MGATVERRGHSCLQWSAASVLQTLLTDERVTLLLLLPLLPLLLPRQLTAVDEVLRAVPLHADRD